MHPSAMLRVRKARALSGAETPIGLTENRGLNFDLNLNTARQLKLHQGVNSFRRRTVDV